MDDVVAALVDRIEFLRTVRVDVYRRAALPDPVDETVTSLIELYMSSPNELRRAILVRVAPDHALTLLFYGERMASYAINQRSEAVLVKGLVAIGIAGDRYDFRDAFMILSLFWRTAKVLGLSLPSMIDRAAQYLDDDGVQLLNDFDRRTDDLKSPAAMGYREAPSEGGLRYLRV